MKELANIRIYGDSDSAVHVGPKGTTMPTTLDAPGVGFDEIGWISTDGVSIGKEQDNASFNAWQGGKRVRTKTTSSEDSFTFQALEENGVVMGLWEPGATITTTAGVTKIVPPEGVGSDERAFVLDFFDGDVHKRYNVIRGEVTSRTELPHQNEEMTTYEFEVAVYEYEILTNNPALAVS